MSSSIKVKNDHILTLKIVFLSTEFYQINYAIQFKNILPVDFSSANSVADDFFEFFLIILDRKCFLIYIWQECCWNLKGSVLKTSNYTFLEKRILWIFSLWIILNWITLFSVFWVCVFHFRWESLSRNHTDSDFILLSCFTPLYISIYLHSYQFCTYFTEN